MAGPVDYVRRPFVRTPYESNSRMADLILRQGQQQADAVARRGEASANLWGQVGQGIASTVGNFAQNRAIEQQRQRDEPRRQMQEQSAAMGLEGQRMELDAAKGEQVKKAAVAEAIAKIKGGNAEEVLSALTPEARLTTEQYLAASAETRAKREQLQALDRRQRAETIQKMGYDEGISEILMGLDDDPRVKSIWQQVVKDPAQRKQAIDMFASYGREDKTPDAFTLSPGQQRFGPDGKPLASVPAAAPVQAPFNLSPGQTRFGPDGKPIANLPPAPVREPREPVEPLVPIIGPDGQPVLVPRSQAVGQRPASTREQGRQVASGDVGRISELNTSISDLDVLSQTLGTTGAGSKVGAMLPNVVTEVTGWGMDSKSRQGTIDRVKQVIGKALEGGVLRKEDEVKYEKILPTIGDPPQVARTKLEGLKKALVQRRQTFLDDLERANYDVTKYATPSAGGGQKADPLGIR